MLEVDYPHGDGTWPDTQAVIERYWGHIPVDELRKMTHRNAAQPSTATRCRTAACHDGAPSPGPTCSRRAPIRSTSG